MLKILVQQILRMTLSHLSRCRLGIQLDLCTSGALPPTQHSPKWHMSIREAKWTFAPLVLASACDLRDPHRHTRLAFEAHSGATTFPPEGSVNALISTAHPLPATPFSVSTITDGNARVGSRSALSCPFVGLTVHRAVSVRRSTTGRWPSR